MLDIKRGTHLTKELFPPDFKAKALEELRAATDAEQMAKIHYQLGLYEHVVAQDNEAALRYFEQVRDFARGTNHVMGSDAFRKIFDIQIVRFMQGVRAAAGPLWQWVADQEKAGIMERLEGYCANDRTALLEVCIKWFDWALRRVYISLLLNPMGELDMEVQEAVLYAWQHCDTIRPLVEEHTARFEFAPETVSRFHLVREGINRAVRVLDPYVVHTFLQK